MPRDVARRRLFGRTAELPRLQIRPLTTSDASSARALVLGEVGGTPYTELPLTAVRRALDAEGEEVRGLVAIDGQELVGLVLYGWVAGALATGKLHLIAVTAAARLRGVGSQLCESAVSDLASSGARLVIAEVPDDPALRPGLLLLQRCGLGEEGRIADFHRDGIALVLLRRDLGR